VVNHTSPDSTRFPVTGISRFQSSQTVLEKQQDQLAIEEPLEIILCHPDSDAFSLAITMRTPGNDEELACGFLFAEGIIRQAEDIEKIEQDQEAPTPGNTQRVHLSHPLSIKPEQLQRHFFTHSACGVCGKTSIQALEMQHQPRLSTDTPRIPIDLLYQLPDTLLTHQAQFARTGGVHSAALFSASGELLQLREDVGRHNALDKLLGFLLLQGKLDQARSALLLVSGRASFELVQKALMADIPWLIALGAPTSLAMQLAQRHQMTLAGFLKSDSVNVYTGLQRIHK
jgi:FdhD protein